MANEEEFSENQQQLPELQERRVPLLPDPGLIWQVFRRNLLMFSLVVVGVLGLTALYLAIQTPQYAAQASLLIDPVAGPVRTSEPGRTEQIVNADQVDTEIRLVGSPLVTSRAAELYADRFASPDGDAFSPVETEALATVIRSMIQITRSGQTSVVDITGVSSDPAMAAAVPNLVAESYLQLQVEAKTSESDSANAFINERLSELEANALRTQAAVDNYRAARGLVGVEGATNTEQEVSNLNQQLASAQADLAEQVGRYNAARAQLSRGSGGADVGAALGSGTIGSLRAQEAAVSAELATLTERYGPLYPERRQTERELADIRKRIQEEINRVLSNLQAEVQTARSRVQSLSSSRSSAVGTLTQNSRAQAGLNELEQRAEAAQSIYQSFLQRSQETGALRDSALPDARIASRAAVPEFPVSPNRPLIVTFGTIVALGLGVLSILLAEYLRRGVQTKRDIEKRLRLRYAGAIPSLKSTVKGRRPLEPPHLYVLNHPHSLFAEAFRSIRTFLTLSPGKRPRAIAITSALPREGKTTTSVCLSLTTAAEGARVILIDADLRRRGASEILEFDQPHDLFDYFEGTQPLEACVQRDERTGLDLLGSLRPPDTAHNPFTEAKLSAALDEMRDKYDVIIIDTAPILGVAEARVLASLADRVLLITQWKKTSMRAVEATVDMLLDAGAKVTGMAPTQVNIKKYASTGDGDIYAYTKKFRGYYTD